MAAYMQTTIHSRIAKFQKNNGDGSLGRIYKGPMLAGKTQARRANRTFSHEDIDDNFFSQKNEEEAAPVENQEYKSKKSQPSNMKKKSNEQILFESQIFPAIYFKKTTMRSILKQFIFPNNCKALPPNDDRSPLAFQIVANLFSQIVFYVFNLLIAQDSLTNSYFIFFSDSQTIPYTKCCQAPIHIQMHVNGTGRIMCNAAQCPHPSLAQFLISYEDGRKLWNNMTYLSSAVEKDQVLKGTIAKYIKSGKHKMYKLHRLVDKTSKQVESIFERSKFDEMTMQQEQKIDEDTNFITNPPEPQNSKEDPEGIVDPSQKNIQVLKIKLQYMTKRQKGLNKKFAKSIVEESKVFHQRFEMIQKIDELLSKERRDKDGQSFNRTPLNFPKLMSHLKTKEERRAKSMSRTQGNGFKE